MSEMEKAFVEFDKIKVQYESQKKESQTYSWIDRLFNSKAIRKNENRKAQELLVIANSLIKVHQRINSIKY